MKLHLWKCYNPNKISVDISNNLKTKIENKIKGKISEISKKLKINHSRLYEYFVYKNFPIPLNVLIKLSKILKIPLLKIEKEITMYKQLGVPLKNSVKNPKLPIELNPYLTSIVSNLFFDGSVPKDGKGTYYNQKSKEVMERFIQRIKFVFGEVYYSLTLDHKKVLKCRVPRIIGEICRQIYQVNSFGSFESRIPKKIFNLDDDHKVAFIISAIMDEGSITYDGYITFGVCNKNLLEDLSKLCVKVGLNITKINNKKLNNRYHYISIKSKEKFYDLYKKFKEKYPIISLDYKEKRLKHSIRVSKLKVEHTKNFANLRKKKILELIKNKPLSINQISYQLLIPPRSVRRHISSLIKDERVMLKDKIRYEHTYLGLV